MVAEWRTSMHANATLDRDPLFRLLYTKARKVVGPKVEKRCPQCHAPLSLLSGPPRPNEGVSCVVCHRIAPTHPAPLPGGKMSELARTTPGQPPGSGLCLSCHAEMKNPAGELVCTTGAEVRHSTHQKSCVDCHMEEVQGPATVSTKTSTHRGHTFPGGHVASYLRNKIDLRASFEPGKRALTVIATAAHTGHALPTGNPMRHIALRVTALDAGGAVLWGNLGSASPPFDDPDALLMRVFSDAEGNKPVPPFAAKGPSVDQRLQAGESRTLRYTMPPKAVRFRAVAEYHLGPAKLLRAAGLPAAQRAPVIMRAIEGELR